jgi:hypothetical protein
MREADIEAYLRDQIKKAGGIAYKFVSPGNVGVPDRILVLPKGRTIYIELKSPGMKSTPMQEKQQRRIASLGHDVRVIDSKQKVDDLIKELLA